MSFLSLTWLFWVWITVALYWLTPHGWRQMVLIGVSLLFLAILSPVSAAILIVFCAICHLATRRHVPGSALVAAAICLIVAVLCFYKLRQSIDPMSLVETAAVPLGVSYFSFRCIHFLIERYKGHLGPAKLTDLVGYLFFLPTFVIGPIHRYDDYVRDHVRQRFDADMLSEGAERILYGYAKITILSNYLTENVLGGWINTLSDQDAPVTLYMNLVKNGLNLYFQFSGYSDIAIGFARLLGFRIIENFNWPYLQTNISAFWRSWHISLSRWSRDYVYAPVVATTRSPALGALCSMAVIGLWHEVSLRFLLWGAYHGLGLVAWQQSQRLAGLVSISWPANLLPVVQFAKVLATVHFVWFGFVILTADGPMAALEIYRKILFGWM